MEIRKELMEKKRRIITEKKEMVGRVKLEKQRWRIMGVYIKENMEKMLQKLEEWVEEMGREVCTLIGGNFNAKTGSEGKGCEMGEETEGNMEEEGKKRKSKDGKINKEGKRLISFLEERR